MKLILLCVLVTTLLACTSALHPRKRFLIEGAICYLYPTISWCAKQTFQTYYGEMKDANCLHCDKYFHCKANYETAHGSCNDPESAKKLSECRDPPDNTDADSLADTAANEYGRSGGDCAARYLCSNNCKYNPADQTCSRSNCP